MSRYVQGVQEMVEELVKERQGVRSRALADARKEAEQLAISITRRTGRRVRAVEVQRRAV